MSKLYRRYSIALARFMNGKATELETVMALQIDSDETLAIFQKLEFLNRDVSGLPLWRLDHDALEPKDQETGYTPPKREDAMPIPPKDDETCRVWVAIKNKATGHFLLNVRSAKCNNAGQFGLPGGHKHVGESHADGASRELCEETGIKVDSSELVMLGSVDNDGVCHIVYVKEFENIAAIRKAGLVNSTEEVDDMKWSTLTNMRSMVKRDQRAGRPQDRQCHKSVRRLLEVFDN